MPKDVAGIKTAECGCTGSKTMCPTKQGVPGSSGFGEAVVEKDAKGKEAGRRGEECGECEECEKRRKMRDWPTLG